MKTVIVKSLFMAMVVLAMAMMVSCDLAVPVETGRSVEVVLGGLAGARAFGDEATWVSIKVVLSGVETGSAVLSKTGGVWKGKISVTGNGTMTFTAISGSVASQVSWIGRNTYNVGTASGPLTITVAAPAVTTAADNGYGPAGGKIFYDKGSYSDGWRYLEAAPIDESTEMGWSTIATLVNTSTGIGTGQANTTKIVDQSGCVSGAAKTCDDKVLGGYSDWFLPSQDEVGAMYGMKAAIGGFVAWYYWSSSETSATAARLQLFDNSGDLDAGNKATDEDLVRAVRAF